MTEQELIQLVADALRYASGVAVGRSVDGKIMAPAAVTYARVGNSDDVEFLINGRRVRLSMVDIRAAADKPQEVLDLVRDKYLATARAEQERWKERQQQMNQAVDAAWRDVERSERPAFSPRAGRTVRSVEEAAKFGIVDEAFKKQIASLRDSMKSEVERAERERREMDAKRRAEAERLQRLIELEAEKLIRADRLYTTRPSKVGVVRSIPEAQKPAPIAARPAIEEDGKRKFFLD
jgi:hypothetical protein